MDIFVAGRDQSAADQPNYLADGPPPIVTICTTLLGRFDDHLSSSIMPDIHFIYKRWLQSDIISRCHLASGTWDHRVEVFTRTSVPERVKTVIIFVVAPDL